MFIAILGVIFTTQAFAYPAVGDRADLAGETLFRNSEIRPLELVTELIGYDQFDRKWNVRLTESRNGQRRIREEKHAAIFNPTLYREMMERCRSRGGRVEKITVPAGTFDVCHLFTAVTAELTEETWYGNVPFGVVKKVETYVREGRQDRLELKSYRSDPQSEEK